MKFKKYGNNWRRVRKAYIKASPLCEMCLRNGRTTIATEIHHIKPINQGGVANDWNNLMSLCEDCHKKIHKRGKYKNENNKKQIIK